MSVHIHGNVGEIRFMIREGVEFVVIDCARACGPVSFGILC